MKNKGDIYRLEFVKKSATMGHTPVKFNKWILQTGGVLLMIMAFPSIVFGQEAKQQDSITAVPFFSLSGTLTLTSDFYTYSSTPDGSQRGRRPASLYRLLFSPTLKFGNAISLPFHIVLTVPETNTSTPSVRHPTVIQFLQNPANAFGFSSFAPRIGWAQFNLGSYSPNFSPLTVGDQQLFGAGFDLRPGNFRIAANLGTSQRAIEPDTIRHIPGAYKRDMYMGRFAFGKEDGSILGVNLVYAKDVQSSLKNNISSISLSHPLVNNLSVIIPADTFRLRAEEGIVTSFDAKVKITNTISFKAEGALSSFTRDLHAPELTSNKNPLDIIQKTRTSTRADFAAATTFTIKQEQWGIKFSGRYMGAGFVPVGYPYMQADRIEFAGAPNFNLFNNKLSVSGSIGQRVNNVSKTKGETSTQLIASADVNLNLSNAFSISSSYSNFGIRNDKTSDTLKVQTVSQAVSINPILTLKQ
ncbi:MAG: hypothetical protein ABJB16_03310, partial [Saprospiraceae bacterium]